MNRGRPGHNHPGVQAIRMGRVVEEEACAVAASGGVGSSMETQVSGLCDAGLPWAGNSPSDSLA